MGPQTANQITSLMSLSERADHLEEQMMHELDNIITKSVFSNLTDGRVEMEGGEALRKKHPGKYMNMGPDPRLRRRCRTSRPCWIILSTGSPRATTCCKAVRWRSRTATARRWRWRACSTTSRWSASSAATTATGVRR